jgi:hypothetical protein
MFTRKSSVLVGVVVAIGMSGCGESASESSSTEVVSDQVSVAGHTHEGWWCAEHGVPEEVCTRCDPKLVADFKARGDWCEAHDRPESQCFICHPEKKAEFIALYEAKYGKQPPATDADDGGEL